MAPLTLLRGFSLKEKSSPPPPRPPFIPKQMELFILRLYFVIGLALVQHSTILSIPNTRNKTPISAFINTFHLVLPKKRRKRGRKKRKIIQRNECQGKAFN